MANCDVLTSQGLALAYSEDGMSWTTVGELVDLDGPEVSTDVNERKLKSPANNFKRKCPGLIDPGEISFTVNLEKELVTAIYGYQTARTILFWKVTCPALETESSGSYGHGSGFVSKFKWVYPDTDPINNPVTVTLDGEWEWEEGVDS